MASRGKGARLKGANFERQLAKKLTDATNIEFKRGLGQTRRGGAEVADVVCDALPMIHIEAKRQKRCNIKAAMFQAVDDIGATGKIPIVITKDDHQDILVTMKFEDWVAIFNESLPGKRRKQDRYTKK